MSKYFLWRYSALIQSLSEQKTIGRGTIMNVVHITVEKRKNIRQNVNNLNEEKIEYLQQSQSMTANDMRDYLSPMADFLIHLLVK